jgi:phosphoribosyl 1,2-cyclic phosphate phosphodiesterase
LEMINEIQPEKAYLTHLSHSFGKHADLQNELPANVYVGYDGLKIVIG